MKCPECNYNQRRGREGMRCRKCRYQFRLDPKNHSSFWKITDGSFLALLRRATGNGTRFITEDELYTHACGRTLQRGWLTSVIILGSIVLLTFVGMITFRNPAPVIFFSFSLLILLLMIANRPFLKRKRWDKIVRTWTSQGGEIPNLIQTPTLHTPPPEWQEPDIYDYGFERLVICEDPLTVDWLVKNGLHTSENALVICEDGYPEYLLPRAQQALNEASTLPVFLFHGSDTSGTEMETRLRQGGSFPLARHPVTDLGIDRATVHQLRLPRELRPENITITPHGLPYVPLMALLPYAFLHQAPLVHASVSGANAEFSTSFG